MMDYLTAFKESIDESLVESFLLDDDINDEQRAEVLKALNERLDGDLLAAFIAVLKRHQTSSVYLPGAVDNCGTGGSGLPRLNTSTLSAFVLSSLGIPMAKHGNKAASGRFGSFDLLESLGIEIHQKSEHLQYLYYKTNLAFLFARDHHPMVGRFTAARKLVGGPTIFNYLGPLLNPVDTDFQIIGTSSEQSQRLIAQAALKLGKKVAVVRGLDGLDEISVSGVTKVMEIAIEGPEVRALGSGKSEPRALNPETLIIKEYSLTPQDFGVEALRLEEVLVEEVEDKIALSQKILAGDLSSPHSNLILVNAAFVLKALGKVETLKEGVEMVREALTSGKVQKQFETYRDLSQSQNILTEIVGDKYSEIGMNQKNLRINESTNLDSRFQILDSSFKSALLKPGLSVIAEVKKASPSKGLIYQGDFDPVAIAQDYKSKGANAISVLCDEKYFQGSFEYMKAVAEAVDLPVICKEFIIDESQIEKAVQYGASAILLIAAVLDIERLEALLQRARELGLEALVEVHTEEELNAVLEHTSAEIVGINNRNLKDFTVDIGLTKRLIEALPHDKKREIVFVAESGISSGEDIKALPRETSAILIGEGVVNEPAKIQTLKAARPIVKICGVKDKETLEVCEEAGVDLVGLNFVPSSRRYIDVDQAGKLINSRQGKDPGRAGMTFVGIFQDQPLEYVNEVSEQLDLDFIQLSGEDDLDFIQSCCRRVIKGVCLESEESIDQARALLDHVAFILFDSSRPGSGQTGNLELLKKVDFPYLLAGGVTPNKAPDLLSLYQPLGLDSASGVETDGKKDGEKICALVKNINPPPLE